MKKSIIILSTMTIIAFTSCDNKQEVVETSDEVTTVEDEPVVVDEENTSEIEDVDVVESDDVESEVVESDVDTPDFDNAELQSFMDSYDTYMADYKEAMTSQDMSKIQALSSQGEELSQKAQNFGNLSAADADKLATYLEKQAQEMQKIAMEAAGQ